jgi:hypothetical protein
LTANWPNCTRPACLFGHAGRARDMTTRRYDVKDPQRLGYVVWNGVEIDYHPP